MRMTTTIPTDPDVYPFVHEVRARFAETDAMGVVHHAAYLPWLEETRVEYLRSVGRPYVAVREEGFDFTIVEVAALYERPVRFDDVVEVRLRIAAVTGATFRIDYLLTAERNRCARAATLHGVTTRTGRPTRTPGWLRTLQFEENSQQKQHK